MSGPSRKSAEIGLFHPFSAFFTLFRRARRAPGKSRKRRKKAFFLRYPQICLNPHLLNPHLRHSKTEQGLKYFRDVSVHFSYRVSFGNSKPLREVSFCRGAALRSRSKGIFKEPLKKSFPETSSSRELWINVMNFLWGGYHLSWNYCGINLFSISEM